MWAQVSVLVSCHVIRKSASQRAKNLVWRVVGSTSGPVEHFLCKLAPPPLLEYLREAASVHTPKCECLWPERRSWPAARDLQIQIDSCFGPGGGMPQAYAYFQCSALPLYSSFLWPVHRFPPGILHAWNHYYYCRCCFKF